MKKSLIAWSIFWALLITYLNLALFLPGKPGVLGCLAGIIFNGVLMPILLIPWIRIYCVKNKGGILNTVLYLWQCLCVFLFIIIVIIFAVDILS